MRAGRTIKSLWPLYGLHDWKGLLLRQGNGEGPDSVAA